MLNSLPSKAGSQFMECLGFGLYNIFSNYANNITDKQIFCCPSYLTAAPQTCKLPSAGCYTTAQCNKIGQSRFCIIEGAVTKVKLPGDLCGGTLGDLPI